MTGVKPGTEFEVHIGRGGQPSTPPTDGDDVRTAGGDSWITVAGRTIVLAEGGRGAASPAAATAGRTQPSTASLSSGCPATPAPATTSPGRPPPDARRRRSSACSSGRSPGRSSATSPHRSASRMSPTSGLHARPRTSP
ncbi:hypothetical protein [Streptomyces litmocidini]|uniref:hypothetical protein n=1 Tax=Streptomyces litmocidini TaxID=67318 RepID=UPI0035709585